MPDRERISQEVNRLRMQHDELRAELHTLLERQREVVSILEADPLVVNDSIREIVAEIARVVDGLMDVSQQLTDRDAQLGDPQNQSVPVNASRLGCCETEETADLKFFMPGVTDADVEERFQSLRQQIIHTSSLVVSNRRICCIEYTDERRIRVTAQVGKKLSRTDGEIVVAILDASLLYFICTPGHGYEGGKPIVVFAADVSKVRFFGE